MFQKSDKTRRNYLLCIALVSISSFLISCGEMGEFTNLNDQEENGQSANQPPEVSEAEQTSSLPTSFRSSNLVDIGTRMTEFSHGFNAFDASATALSLTNITKYSISLENCLSGYTHISNELDPNIRAYKFDTGCLAKLVSFEYDSINYVPSDSEPFDTWQLGDVAVFEDENNVNNTMYVRVLATLSNPILGTEVVNYGIYHNVNIGDNRSILDVSLGVEGLRQDTGVTDQPSFEIVSVNLVGETLTGGFQVEIILNCTVAMVGDICGAYDLADTSYTLFEDTYTDQPSLADLIGLHSSSGRSIDPAFDKLLPGEMGAANGGFKTTLGAEILTTPDDVHLNPNMIFSIEGLAESWYFFNVDVVIQSEF